MANTFKKDPGRLRMTAPSGGWTSGQVVVVRTGATGMIGVSLTAVSAGDTGVVEIVGEHSLPKATGSAHTFAVGDIVYWDVGDGNCQATASANVKAGIATVAAAAGDTTVTVMLIPSKA